jgi:hypothetical protein
LPIRQGIGVEVGSVVSVKELSFGENSNHRGVVRAERGLCQAQLEPFAFT